MKVAQNIMELIGETPLIKLNNINTYGSNIYLKLESFNPGSSIKDRVALNMIVEAEKAGKLKKGYVIVEPTSGNTGIGIAMIGAAKGYEVILVMPDTMSIERRKLLKAYGAKIILTDGSLGMNGAIDKAQELAKTKVNYHILQQFDNKDNPKAHMKTTALEIINQMDGKIDAFVSAVGTGGTITGVSKILKENIDKVKIVAVEPESSAVLSGGSPGPHKIQGIGAGFIPKVLEVEVIDNIQRVKDDEAILMARKIAIKEGILVGISSGAAVKGALKYASNLKESQNIVVIAPDYGERYLSTSLYED